MKSKHLIAIATAAALAGCATGGAYQAGNYHNGLQAQSVLLGTVVSIEAVKAAPRGQMNGGGLLGLIAGAALGSAVGHGAGTTIAEGVGGLVGAVAGSKIENRGQQKAAEQVTVILQSGKMIAVVEQGEKFHLHEVVQVVFSGGGGWGQQPGKVRIMPFYNGAAKK